MKFLTLLSLILSGSIYAQTMSKVNADYRCELDGGGIAFKSQTASKKARVWQTDVGEDEGLELKVKSFSTLRCPGCYSFEANLINMPVRGNISNFLLTYEVFDAEDSQWKVLLEDVKCVKAK
jgi:hypothetical protein